MNFRCFSQENISLLYLSPYTTVKWNGEGELDFTQLMFRRFVRLKGAHGDLVELLKLLTGGVGQPELLAMGNVKFTDFQQWLSKAMFAGIIE